MHKTVIQLISQVAAELNLPVPTTVVTSQDQNVKKLFAFLVAVCDDLLAEHSWQDFQFRHTVTTANGVEDYDFPTDIHRFISGTFFDEGNRWPWQGPLTPGQWEWLKTGYGIVGPYERFRIWQDKISFLPVPTGVTTFVCEYISNTYAQDGSTGLRKSEFTQDSDICLFDHRMVVYGIKLKFLASISQDTTAALVDYNRALEFAKSQDTPGPRLSLNGYQSWGRLIDNANLADGSWG